MGPVVTSDSSLEDHALNSTCHCTLARERVPGDRESQLRFTLNGKTKELINPTAVNQMFELDFSDHKNSRRHGLSKEDRRFLEIVEQGIHQCEDGHYEPPLPLKIERIELPNNRETALHRLDQLKQRFQAPKGQKNREDYVNFMKNIIENYEG